MHDLFTTTLIEPIHIFWSFLWGHKLLALIRTLLIPDILLLARTLAANELQAGVLYIFYNICMIFNKEYYLNQTS